jgi:ABC-type multidrug transport system ATPase subunit
MHAPAGVRLPSCFDGVAARVCGVPDGIRVERVTKTFGPVRALVAVSAEFPVGSVSLVIGANGSGKSTLLSLLATLATPTTGKIDHGSFGTSPAQVRRGLGWLGHDTLTYGDLTGRENLELAAQLYALEASQVVESATQRFQLAEFLERPVRTYSRGQRQRIALARALCHAPTLLLLDEPTTGLDTKGVETLLQVVVDERARGTTVVMITHDPSFATRIATQVIELERGRIRSN